MREALEFRHNLELLIQTIEDIADMDCEIVKYLKEMLKLMMMDYNKALELYVLFRFEIMRSVFELKDELDNIAGRNIAFLHKWSEMT